MGQAYVEDEAVLHWCPEARVASVVEMGNGVMNAVPVNRHPERRDPYEGAHCVGSVCAHWTWMPGQGRGNRKGYCGLSGRPET